MKRRDFAHGLGVRLEKHTATCYGAGLHSTSASTELGIDVRLVDVPWGTETRRALVASSETTWQTLSWASRGGGKSASTTYCCLEVRNSDLPIELEPQLVIERFVLALNLTSPVAALTSADVGAFCTGLAREQGMVAFALVTTGFANALRVGEVVLQPTTRPVADTINIACWLNYPLSFEAQLEALSIVAQARTLAVLEAHIESSDHTGLATGTGTDCIALFTLPPGVSNNEPSAGAPTAPLIYAGMHTSVGRIIGKAVRDAMNEATARWITRRDVRLKASRAVPKT